MSTWQERLVEEHRQLSDNIAKLTDFLVGPAKQAATLAHQELLAEQLRLMTALASTLHKRLELAQREAREFQGRPPSTEMNSGDLIAAMFRDGVGS